MQNKKNLFKDKKADIPVMILVIGVIAICSLTLLSFFIAESRIYGSFSGVKDMQALSSGIDDYIFYKNVGFNENEIENNLQIIQDSNGQGKFLYVEKNATVIEPGLNLDWTKEKTVFYAKYLLPN